MLLPSRFQTFLLDCTSSRCHFLIAPLNPPVPAIKIFSSIAPEVGAISSRYYHSCRSALKFLYKFREVKSLRIEIPSSSDIGNDNRCLFKWKVKFGNRIESVFFLSPDSMSDTDGKGEEEEDFRFSIHLLEQKLDIAFQCLVDGGSWHQVLLYIVKDLPMLEEVSISDSERCGRFSLSGGKLAEVKDCMHSDSQTVESGIEHSEFSMVRRMSHCYIPFLKLPVSGLVMKGVTLLVMEMNDVQGGNDSLMISEDSFEDKEEAAYTEAVMELLKKHKDSIKLVSE